MPRVHTMLSLAQRARMTRLERAQPRTTTTAHRCRRRRIPRGAAVLVRRNRPTARVDAIDHTSGRRRINALAETRTRALEAAARARAAGEGPPHVDGARVGGVGALTEADERGGAVVVAEVVVEGVLAADAAVGQVVVVNVHDVRGRGADVAAGGVGFNFAAEVGVGAHHVDVLF